MAGTPESALAAGGPQPTEETLRQLYVESSAAEYGFSYPSFAVLLAEVTAKYVAADATPSEREAFVRSLRLHDLVLARACAAGQEHAWDDFLTRYRVKLYDMAGAIAKEDSAARELADSLYADLYGTATREGQRVSKLTYYTGRGSLEGWLRTVLAQEYVNRYRSRKRLVSLEEQEEQGEQFGVRAAEVAATPDARLDAAIDEALAALAAEERFVLAAYFLDGRTLAEIARMLGVHESTISRKVDKLTTRLRQAIVKGLVARGMGRRQANEALEVDVRDLAVDVRARLTQGTAGAAFNRKSEKT